MYYIHEMHVYKISKQLLYLIYLCAPWTTWPTVAGPAQGISELSSCLGPPGHQGNPNQEYYLFIYWHIKWIKQVT